MYIVTLIVTVDCCDARLLRVSRNWNISLFRLYAVVAFIEGNYEKKMVVPRHWVNEVSTDNDEESCLFWPPMEKGRNLNYYLNKWLAPNRKTWSRLFLTKVLKTYGTKEECDRFLKYHLDSTGGESTDDNTRKYSLNLLSYVCSIIYAIAPIRINLLTLTIFLR